MPKPRLLYIAPQRSTFVENDLDALKEVFEVRFDAFDARLKWKLPFLLLRQLFFLASRRQPEIWVSRFAGFHSLLPSMLAKWRGIKHYVILGGTDCNTLPEIGYGNALRYFMRIATKWSLKQAYKLLPLSEALVASDDRFNRPPGRMGYRNNYPSVATPYEVIPLGVDRTKFNLHAQVERESLSFVTLCSGLESERRRKLKGLDYFLALAARMPQAKFYVIGGERLPELNAPDHVTFLPQLPHAALPAMLNRFGFYVQLSRSEGFSNALLEAMACGCIPIVSDVGVMPELVGAFGLVLRHEDLEPIDEVVGAFIERSSEINRQLCSEYISKKYDISLRKRRLAELFQNDFSGHS